MRLIELDLAYDSSEEKKKRKRIRDKEKEDDEGEERKRGRDARATQQWSAAFRDKVSTTLHHR